MSKPPLFPSLTTRDILDCYFSSWYPKFSHVSIKSTVITPLPPDFLEYLHADGVFAPRGSNDFDSEDVDDSAEEHSDGSQAALSSSFAFPELDERIRKIIADYGAAFPKLNWSAPKDSQWMLSTSEFMRCLTPADVYLTLKASDFIQHDLDPALAFEGVQDPEAVSEKVPLELVLRKWYAFERSREMRCFVRHGVLIGACQRDIAFYDFLAEAATREQVADTIQSFWKEHVHDKWENDRSYVVDILLTRDLKRAHIVDFNPFAPKTDPLLFTYEDLSNMYVDALRDAFTMQLRIIDSASHPRAHSGIPQYQHNMVPLDALSLAQGKDMTDFAGALADAIQEANL